MTSKKRVRVSDDDAMMPKHVRWKMSVTIDSWNEEAFFDCYGGEYQDAVNMYRRQSCKDISGVSEATYGSVEKANAAAEKKLDELRKHHPARSIKYPKEDTKKDEGRDSDEESDDEKIDQPVVDMDQDKTTGLLKWSWSYIQ